MYCYLFSFFPILLVTGGSEILGIRGISGEKRSIAPDNTLCLCDYGLFLRIVSGTIG